MLEFTRGSLGSPRSPLNYARSLSLIVLGELFAGPNVRLIHGIEREQHVDIRRAQTSWLERLFVTPPGKTENVIIASNIGRIGKKADEDDMRVIETGKPNLEVNKKGAITLKSSWCSRINPARQLVRSGLSSCTKRGKKRSSRKRPNRSARR